MASGVLRKHALKLDSLTGYETTDTEEKRGKKKKKGVYESIWATGEGQM